MTTAERVQAARDTLARAGDADELLRLAPAEATVWLTRAVTDDPPMMASRERRQEGSDGVSAGAGQQDDPLGSDASQ